MHHLQQKCAQACAFLCQMHCRVCVSFQWLIYKYAKNKHVIYLDVNVIYILYTWFTYRMPNCMKYPDCKVHGANMGQCPGGPHVGPMNFAILVCFKHSLVCGMVNTSVPNNFVRAWQCISIKRESYQQWDLSVCNIANFVNDIHYGQQKPFSKRQC